MGLTKEKDKQTKHLLELYNQKRFSEVKGIPTDKMLKIDSEEVTKVIKKNYSLLICTCGSSGKTAHNSLCRHKQFFLIFPFLEFFNKNIEKLIDDYKKYKDCGLTPSVDCFLNDLNNLQRVK